MRLIDADKLMLSLADWKLQEAPIHTYEKPKEFTADNMQEMIWRTIRDCESAVEEQPTVEAIPIEWIEMFLEENYPIESPYGTKAYFHDFMKHMIKEWEKENESN